MTPDLRRGDVEPLVKQGLPKAKRRRPLRRFSEKSAAGFDYQKSQRERVFERDGGCVLAGERFIRQDGTVEEHHECVGRLTVHHLRKASSGGGWKMENLVAVCCLANLTIEDQPAWVREHYRWLIVREGDEAWERLARTPRRAS